eukprot:TRINITY_DN1061_c0_g1_i1.p1 TRINITY_DN1061_c0_g1~~TRINITY_DN1061_c0_g1_i1.p1  ORF type:complete len:393 (-),score=48.29 TRINITY_DN1061_c0_g1_i1:317-1495(-)
MCGSDLSGLTITRPLVITTPTEVEVPTTEKKSCRCRKSKCLKLYCECFAGQEKCTSSCKCISCENTAEHARVREEAKLAIIRSRSVDSDGNSVGNDVHVGKCNCRRSGCRKKYCECFNACVECTSACKCVGCVNTGGQIKVPDDSCPDSGLTVWTLANGTYEPAGSAIGIETEMVLDWAEEAPTKKPTTNKRTLADATSSPDSSDTTERPMKRDFLGLERDSSLNDAWDPLAFDTVNDPVWLDELSDSLSEEQMDAVIEVMQPGSPTRPTKRRSVSAEWGLALQRDPSEENCSSKRVKTTGTGLARGMSSELALAFSRAWSEEFGKGQDFKRSASDEWLLGPTKPQKEFEAPNVDVDCGLGLDITNSEWDLLCKELRKDAPTDIVASTPAVC